MAGGHPALDFGTLERSLHEAAVKIASQDPVTLIRGGRVDQINADAGLLLDEMPDDIRHQGMTVDRREADSQRRAHTGGNRAHIFLRDICLVQYSLRFPEQITAWLGQAHHSGGPFQKPDVEPLLKFLDQAADGGLGHRQPLGSMMEVQFFRDGDEHSQVFQLIFHGRLFTPRVMS